MPLPRPPPTSTRINHPAACCTTVAVQCSTPAVGFARVTVRSARVNDRPARADFQFDRATCCRRRPDNRLVRRRCALVRHTPRPARQAFCDSRLTCAANPVTFDWNGATTWSATHTCRLDRQAADLNPLDHAVNLEDNTP